MQKQLLALTLSLPLLALSTVAFGQGKLQGSLDQQTVELGQVVTYRLKVQVSGGAKVDNLTQPGFGSFEVLGSSKGTEFRSINGKTEMNYTFSFQLKATREGVHTITPASANINGKPIKGNAVNAKVVPRGTTPQPPAAKAGSPVFAMVEISEKTPFVGAQVQISYKLLLDESQVGMFGTELTSVKEPSFDGFWIEELEDNRRQRNSTKTVANRRYTVQTLKDMAVFPLKAGKNTIEPLDLMVSVSARSSFRRKKVAVKTEPTVLDVRPLPAGAPEGFETSNVGQYKFVVKADKTSVAVGDPFTVKMIAEGTGMISRLKLPSLRQVGSARVLEPVIQKESGRAGKLVGGRKTAEIVITATEEGTLTIPRVAFHYFDPMQEKYKTINTAPIRIKVAGRSTILEKEEALIAREEVDKPEAIKIAEKPLKPLRPIGEERWEKRSRSVIGAPWFWAGLIGPLLLFVGWLGFGWWRRRQDASGDLRKFKAAPGEAKAALASAEALAGSGAQKEALDTLTSGLVSYIATRLEVPPGSITNRRLEGLLEARKVAPETVQRLVTLRQRCDEARFSALESGDALELVQEGKAVLQALEETI